MAPSAKDRKQRRKEEAALLAQAQSLVKRLNEQPDLFADLPAFRTYARRGLDVELSFAKAAELSAADAKAVFDLCKLNMEAAYNTAWGWSDAAKREELTADAARFILVRPKAGGEGGATPPPPPVAYAHFRYELADHPATDAVLYVYEVQLAAAVQRAGLGRFLMQLLELVARRAGLAAINLTVQDCNEAARALYAGLGYVPDDGSPVPGVDEEGYQVLVKRLPPPPKAPAAPAAGVKAGGAGVPTIVAKAGV